MKRLRPIKLTKADTIRFWAKVDRRDPDECWEWQAACNQWGYGVFQMGGLSFRAHRVAFVLTNGDTKLHVLHHCNNPSCCNFRHLYAGTNSDNMRQCVADGRHARVGCRGEKSGKAKLTKVEIKEIRILCASGFTQRWIAKQFGISKTHVGCIARRERWKHFK